MNMRKLFSDKYFHIEEFSIYRCIKNAIGSFNEQIKEEDENTTNGRAFPLPTNFVPGVVFLGQFCPWHCILGSNLSLAL
jgi:hypothetical protein